MSPRMSKALTRVCVIGLFLSPFNIFFANVSPVVKPVATGPITYAEIGDKMIGALSAMNQQVTQETDSYLHPLHEAEKRKLVFSILAKSNAYLISYSHEKADEALRNLVGDIELFTVLFPKINRTATVFGEGVFAKMVATPTFDVDVLHRRQAFVQKLIEDEVFFEQVAAQINKLKKAEQGILAYWREEDKTSKELVKSFYYNNSFTKGYNNSANALELAARLDNFWSAFPLIADVVQTACLRYMFNQKIDPISTTEALRRAFNSYYNPMAIWTEWGEYEAGKHDDYLKKIFSQLPLKDSGESVAELARKTAILNSKAQLMMLPWNFWSKWQTFKSVKSAMSLRTNAMCRLQEQLMSVATLVDVVGQFEALARHDAVFADAIITRKNMGTLHVKAKESKDLALLLKTLKTSTFKGSPSFFSYAGRILLAHRLMETEKDHFCGVLETCGEIDACLSIARVLKEFKDERVHYSFAQYSDAATPYTKMTNFWNPMVSHTVVVPNSLELGAMSQKRSVVVTGSNTGGKSTLLKGMLITVLLAQTLGIGPADDIVLTPYIYIGSSLNIVDNTEGGKSLFQAEVDRAISLMKASEFFMGIGHCFLVVDELFRGTGPERAEVETYNCAKTLITHPNTSLVLATHFIKKVTTLEAELHGLCKNYKIEVKVGADGKLIRPFKLEEGVNSSNVAGNILDNALVNNRINKS
jgi:DNA mismatch repair protein MutS